MTRSTPRREAVCPRCGVGFTYASLDEHTPFPFCSPRCREIDLGKWLTGQYVITGREAEETDSEAPASPQDKK
jgi:endogenous inhibitor of DNA gyrase (YacG/DUF329 family)